MSFLIFFIIAIFIFGVSLILTLVRGVSSLIFGRSSSYTKTNNYTSREQKFDTSQSTKKIFSKEEGEYVSYEEIKE